MVLMCEVSVQNVPAFVPDDKETYPVPDGAHDLEELRIRGQRNVTGFRNGALDEIGQHQVVELLLKARTAGQSRDQNVFIERKHRFVSLRSDAPQQQLGQNGADIKE